MRQNYDKNGYIFTWFGRVYLSALVAKAYQFSSVYTVRHSGHLGRKTWQIDAAFFMLFQHCLNLLDIFFLIFPMFKSGLKPRLTVP
jgi:hypothetical protein